MWPQKSRDKGDFISDFENPYMNTSTSCESDRKLMRKCFVFSDQTRVNVAIFNHVDRYFPD